MSDATHTVETNEVVLTPSQDVHSNFENKNAQSPLTQTSKPQANKFTIYQAILMNDYVRLEELLDSRTNKYMLNLNTRDSMGRYEHASPLIVTFSENTAIFCSSARKA